MFFTMRRAAEIIERVYVLVFAKCFLYYYKTSVINTDIIESAEFCGKIL